MKGKIIGLLVVLGILAVLPLAVQAHGNSPAKLGNAGWFCFNVPGLGVHCVPPGTNASTESVSVLVFDTSDPAATHATFLGTELLIRADLYHGQPCPQDNSEHYHFLPASETGLAADYYACHHYDTSE